MIGHEVARIAIGCRRRPFRQHGVIPGLPVALEPIEDIFLPILEIGALTRVLDDIEEKLVAGDPQIFPIAVADGALRSGLVAPVQLARMRCRAAGRSAPHPRKLYWRYKAGSQRAIRDGDWKYLRIAGNEFLFDVVKDPRERANLKDRQKDVFDGLKSNWEAWNDTMLPERATPAAYSNPGNFVADHYGVSNPATAASSGGAPTR